VRYQERRWQGLQPGGVVGRAGLLEEPGGGDMVELERLFLSATAAAALGLDGGADVAAMRDSALQVVVRWRERAADPLADPVSSEVCETAARTGEAIYGSLTPA